MLASRCVLALGLVLGSVLAEANTLERIGDEFVHGAKHVPTWKTAIVFGAGTAAMFVAKSADRPLYEDFTYKSRGAWTDVGNAWGTPYPAIGLFAVGQFFPSGHKFQRFGETLAAAMISSTIVNGILKYSIGRTRPSGLNHLSMPSGHTTVAFTTAAVLQQYYGWAVGVPAYLLATVTAAARVADGAHWFSDTVMGATIGIGVAELFRHADDENAVQIVPYSTEDPVTKSVAYGVRVTVPWSI